MKALLTLFLTFGLFGCMSDPARHQAQVSRFVHPGVEAVSSRWVTVRHGPHHVLRAQIRVLRQGGRVSLVAAISQRRDGVHRALRLTRGWWLGKALPWRKAPRGSRACVFGGCTDYMLGFLLLSGDSVLKATRDGYFAHLAGVDGAFDIYIPPELFSRTLENARTAGLFAPAHGAP